MDYRSSCFFVIFFFFFFFFFFFLFCLFFFFFVVVCFSILSYLPVVKVPVQAITTEPYAICTDTYEYI